jgi:hypothetical protein
MFNWIYSRDPKTTVFTGGLMKVLVSKNGEEAEETVLHKIDFVAVEMNKMLETLHDLMKGDSLPCKVTILTPTKAVLNGRSDRVWELDEEMIQVIKTNLPRALELWAPRHQICDVRPFAPTLKQENSNGTES